MNAQNDVVLFGWEEIATISECDRSRVVATTGTKIQLKVVVFFSVVTPNNSSGRQECVVISQSDAEPSHSTPFVDVYIEVQRL